jgi:hypothetical protein
VEEALALMIPIVLFLVTGAAVCVYLVLKFRLRKEVQATYRLALEKGSELSPEVLEAISGDAPKPQQDLRRGLFWAAIGGALAIAGLVQGEPEAIRPVLGVAALPLLIGAAYLGLWILAREEQ